MRAVFAFVFLGILLTAGCTHGGNPPPNGSTGTAITETMCTQYGGHWNPCGSACRGAPPGTACIEMCVPYCECGGIAGFGCPPGYVCTDYLPSPTTPDALGTCKKTSD